MPGKHADAVYDGLPESELERLSALPQRKLTPVDVVRRAAGVELSEGRD